MSMPIRCSNINGLHSWMSSDYNDEVKEIQKRVVSIEIKLFEKLLKEANNNEMNGACKFAMNLHDELQKNGLELSLFARGYSDKEIDDSRIIIKVLLSNLEGEYMKWLKGFKIIYGKPPSKVFIDDNIFEYHQTDDNSTKIIKSILPLFNVHKKIWPSYNRLIVGVDFDGVIHEHNLPFTINPKDLMGYKVNKEIRSLLRLLKSTFGYNIKIDIVTMRAYNENHENLVRHYLCYHKIPFDVITHYIHPETNLMIDDNAVLVQTLDDMNGLMKYIANRLPWHKTKKEKTMAPTKKAATKKVAPKKAVTKTTAKKPAAKKAKK